MPYVKQDPNLLEDGKYFLTYRNYCDHVPRTHSYPVAQTFIRFMNQGTSPMTVTIAGQITVVQPRREYSLSGSITSFTVSVNVPSIQMFQVESWSENRAGGGSSGGSGIAFETLADGETVTVGSTSQTPPEEEEPPPTPVVPNVPTGLAATAGSTQVALTWNAVSGATSYKVYRNGVLVSSPTATNYTNTGLNNGTTYAFTVSAVNAAGESAQSSSVSSTPAAQGQSVGVNLFNKDTVTAGNYVSTSTGANTALAGWNASDYIALELRQIYTANPTGGNKAYYDASHTYTQAGNGIGLNGADYVGTPRRSYLRVSVQDAGLNTYSFIKTGKVNLIDITANTADKALNTADGTLTTSTGIQASDFIPVVSGSTYVQPGNSLIVNRCEYDSGKVFLRSVANNLADVEHTPGTNTAFVRFSMSNANAPEAYYYLKA